MAVRRSRIKASSAEMRLSRIESYDSAMVYVLLANKGLKYRFGRSKIAYIGTTRRGLKRISESVAERAEEILSNHGVRTLTVKFFSAKGRRRVQMWRKLERAMIFSFRGIYGDVPKYNSQGKWIQEEDVFRYFARDAVREIVKRIE